MMEIAADWIWSDDRRPNTYCCARGRMKLLGVPASGILRIVADSRYQLWVNGRYVGQGPTPFKRPFLFVDEYDVIALLRAGMNTVAVLGNYHGVAHCTYTPGVPGLLVSLDVASMEGSLYSLASGRSWKVLPLAAFAREVPRRTWATAWCEYYDARLAPEGWEEPGFDDAGWPEATLVDPGGVQLLPRMIAPLHEEPVDAVRVLGVWSVASGMPGWSAEQGITAQLDEELRAAVPGSAGECLVAGAENGMPLAIPASEEGLAIAVDFGEELAGQLELDVDAPAGVVIDLAPAECLRDGRPWCDRKAGEYARRYITRDGRRRWRTFGYDGFRYLYAVVRGPHPALVLHRLGAWRRESALPVRASFTCDDPAITRIWEISCRTMRVCSQDVHIDCPTREQTVAWGDHVWSGCWAAYLTGDASALRHLLLTGEHVIGLARDPQLPDGQLPCYPFSQVDAGPLYDYSLIFVWGIRLYLQLTGDRELPRRLLPVADRVLDWYRGRRGPSGLVELDGDRLWRNWVENTPGTEKGQLFIDHPGLGSHRCPDGRPGLDRRGINGALNFFFIHALDAAAAVVRELGDEARAAALDGEADRVRAAAEAHFFHSGRGMYVDGYLDGEPLDAVSQQTNALAVTSRTCPPERAPAVLARMLDTRDPRLCLAGTYFWTYLADALCQAGMQAAMWDEVVRHWDAMARQGATTWWETFLGDDLDSLCHIWSSVPGYLLLAQVLGVRPAEPGFARVTVNPRCDLLTAADGAVPVPGGMVRVAWAPAAGDRVAVTVHLDGGAGGELVLPPRWVTADARQTALPLAPAACLRVEVRPAREA